MTTKTDEKPLFSYQTKAGDFTLTKWEFSSQPTRFIERNYNFLSEEMSLGTIAGVEVYVGLDFYYRGEEGRPDPTNPAYGKHFDKYTKEELSRFKPEWNTGMYAHWYRYKKNLHEKQRWGVCRLELASFVNGIQIGDRIVADDFVETGYAPSLNADDLGTPVFLDENTTITNWVETHQNAISVFAMGRRAQAVKLINDTQKKLG